MIDVPDDFYKDALHFNDPEDVQEIFQKLEDDNLKMINDNQVLLMNQEKLLQIEQQVRAAKEKEFDD